MKIFKFTRPSSGLDRLSMRWRLLRHKFWVARTVSFVAFMANTIGRFEHRAFHKKKAQGKTIWVDDVFAPPYNKDAFDHYGAQPADLSPAPGHKVRKSRTMQQDEYPGTDYTFAYRTPPLSGNTINGLGETEPRRVVQPFFSRGYSGPWNKLERLFQSINKPSLPNFILKIFWMDRNRMGLPAKRQRPVNDPASMANEIKAIARQHGAALVGITHLEEDMRFEGFDLPYTYAISVALPMDREEMVTAPTAETAMHIQQVYKAVGQVAINVAREIRQMGWPARASTNISADAYEVLHLPIAQAAGLGTLGKHGSLITREHGSNLRLATILTDIPIAVDGPVDIGVDDFCTHCQICTTNCPPGAIFEAKQMVRGEQKWYVDFDKCIPYFVEHSSCGICIEVCPWSEPGRGPLISKKMLERRE